MARIPVRPKVERLQGLLDIASSELERLGHNLILPEGRGYRIFRDYFLRRTNSVWQLTKRQDPVAEFTSSRSALAWCIADKHQQWDLARRIQQLDERIAITDQGLTPRLMLFRAGSRNRALAAKIQHRQQQRYTTKAELDKCVSRAKYLQIRGFRNDTQ
jgi:hypothetical protein